MLFSTHLSELHTLGHSQKALKDLNWEDPPRRIPKSRESRSRIGACPRLNYKLVEPKTLPFSTALSAQSFKSGTMWGGVVSQGHIGVGVGGEKGGASQTKI